MIWPSGRAGVQLRIWGFVHLTPARLTWTKHPVPSGLTFRVTQVYSKNISQKTRLQTSPSWSARRPLHMTYYRLQITTTLYGRTQTQLEVVSLTGQRVESVNVWCFHSSLNLSWWYEMKEEICLFFTETPTDQCRVRKRPFIVMKDWEIKKSSIYRNTLIILTTNSQNITLERWVIFFHLSSSSSSSSLRLPPCFLVIGRELTPITLWGLHCRSRHISMPFCSFWIWLNGVVRSEYQAPRQPLCLFDLARRLVWGLCLLQSRKVPDSSDYLCQ